MDIAIYTLRALAAALTMPNLVIILVILGFILYSQNKKTAVMQKMIIGESINSPLELTISQIVMGIFGGIIASMILTYCGVMFDEKSGIELLFMISIVLMFWKPRFICFSYSGAVLGFISIIFNDFYIAATGMPMKMGNFNIDIVALITLIGVLHIVEGLLIMLDGSRGSIPVFSNREDKIVGGFALKRYWPMPIVILFVINGGNVVSGDVVNTPDWWPLINSAYSSTFLQTAIIAPMTIYGVLGYNSVTFTREKGEKALLSGVFVLAYGVVLSFIAQSAAYGLIWKVIVLIFTPLAHEAMLRIQKLMEVNGKPKYSSEDDGIAVLEVAPSSPAAKMGIESGDRLLEMNGTKITNEKQIMESINGVINYISFKIMKSDGREVEVNHTNLSREKRLGIVFVPKLMPDDSSIVKFEQEQFKEVLDKIKKRDDDEL